MDWCEVQGTELRQWLHAGLEVLYECSNAMRMAFNWWLFIAKEHNHIYACIHTMPCRFDAPLAQSLSSSSLHWQCSLSMDSGMWGSSKNVFQHWMNGYIRLFYSIQVLHTHSVYGWSHLAMRLIWRLSKYGKGSRYCIVFTLMWAWVYPGLVG